MDGDRAFLLEMAELMNGDVAKQMAAIRAAMEQGDAGARRRAAHTLKSTVGTFAATAAYEAALQLEKLDDGQPAVDVAAAYRHLDEEINRLPEKYRAPFVLCYLQGHTNEQAAEELGCPKGTILSRLARGREWLRSRLTRRGLGLAIAGLITSLSENTALAKCLTATAVEPLQGAARTALVSSTVKAAIPFAAGLPVSGLVSTTVTTLTEGVLKAMYLSKAKFSAAIVLAVAVLATGTGWLMEARADREQERTRSAAADRKGERPADPNAALTLVV